MRSHLTDPGHARALHETRGLSCVRQCVILSRGCCHCLSNLLSMYRDLRRYADLRPIAPIAVVSP